MEKYNRLNPSFRKWNDMSDIEKWESFYEEDGYNGNRLRAREKKLLEFFDGLKLPKRAKVLELGYGAGLTSAKVYARGYDITGIDISQKFYDLAVKNCEKFKNDATFEFRVGDAEKLDFPDNTFDCVIGLGFLQYLGNPLTCLKKLYRVLKPGGYIIIGQRNIYGISSIDGPIKQARTLYYLITNSRYELKWQYSPIIYIVYALATSMSPFSERMKSLKIGCLDNIKTGHIKKNTLSFTKLRNLFQDAGFKILKINGAGYLTKKSVIFPKTAKKLDKYLQQKVDAGKTKWINKIGNSIVLLAQK